MPATPISGTTPCGSPTPHRCPAPCPRPTVKRSDLAGFANYGYCASHSRFFWGLRLYLVCTPAGIPMLWALADPKLGEREVLAAMLEVDAEMIKDRVGLLLISDKGFASKAFERSLSEQGITLLRPSRKKEVMQAGEPMLKKVHQLIESVNDTLKGQLDLEQHGARSVEGVAVRVAQRVLALAAAIWHNFRTCQPVTRSLTAYDH
ncbi:transposase [Saccharopolyspora sp. ASAGF58]|uniref:transposase n=1 Tax=Saccharopolyspora sp. ASAGF58 TaxID=2719023 RepID=UPI001FF0AD15|nr:transposase [Saccharopolyspora sp. ASAGF58]